MIPKQKAYRQVSSCVCESESAVCGYDETSREISANTFFRHVDRQELERAFGYDGNLRVANDWHVSYSVGVLHGKRTYTFHHSRIHYFYQEPRA